ncbi:MAG: hypothetical protein ACYC0L_00705 [Thermoleophilia bacterium]
MSEKVIDRVTATWIEEYKMLGGDIMKRVELQQKNLSLHLVFLSAIAGYLFKFGLDKGFCQIINNEVLILAAIAPLVSQVFTWRHVDHDSNIIDKAIYIENVISPNLNRLLGQEGLLGFEKSLAKARRSRLTSVGIFSLFGNDHVITISYALIYLASSWFIIFNNEQYAGSLKKAFSVLIILDSLFMVITIYMVIKNVSRYHAIGKIPKNYFM